MATLKETFTNIADAIREKDGSTDKITPANMPQKIRDIPSGSSTNDYLQLKVNTRPGSGYWFYNFSTMTDDDLVDYLAGVSFAQATAMQYTFYQCFKLTTIPLMDTSSVTDMSDMFSSCTNLTSVPEFDTSKVTNMSFMFLGCSSLTSVPAFNTSRVTNMNSMFRSCTNLTSVPAFNTSNVTNMSFMFRSCTNLTSVPAFNTSNVTDMSRMFYNCSSLKEIHMTGMKVGFDISDTALEHDALVEVIGNLATVTNSPTLTMGSTKLALLSDAEKKIATDKGWVLC